MPVPVRKSEGITNFAEGGIEVGRIAKVKVVPGVSESVCGLLQKGAAAVRQVIDPGMLGMREQGLKASRGAVHGGHSRMRRKLA